jgi:hypothetical protein
MIRLFEVHGIIWVFCEMRSNIFDKYVHPLKQNDYFQKKKNWGRMKLSLKKVALMTILQQSSKGFELCQLRLQSTDS